MSKLKLADSLPVGPDGVIVLTYEPAAKGQGQGRRSR